MFCHDELVCKMATHPESLTLQVAACCYQDMLTMVETEKKHRKALLEGGVRLVASDWSIIVNTDL